MPTRASQCHHAHALHTVATGNAAQLSRPWPSHCLQVYEVMRYETVSPAVLGVLMVGLVRVWKHFIDTAIYTSYSVKLKDSIPDSGIISLQFPIRFWIPLVHESQQNSGSNSLALLESHVCFPVRPPSLQVGICPVPPTYSLCIG